MSVVLTQFPRIHIDKGKRSPRQRKQKRQQKKNKKREEEPPPALCGFASGAHMSEDYGQHERQRSASSSYVSDLTWVHRLHVCECVWHGPLWLGFIGLVSGTGWMAESSTHGDVKEAAGKSRGTEIRSDGA